jgi:NADP-dependent 3-hydroxy acid dehydrogenase YdfG
VRRSMPEIPTPHRSTPAAVRPLDGARALVTGASGGIGRALARALGAAGARVCLVARRAERLEEVARDLQKVEATALTHPADLTRDDDVRRLTERISRELEGLDLLVLSSGIIAHAPHDAAPVGDLDAQYRANVRAPYLLTQSLLPLLKAAGGQVVFINSSAGLQARANSGQFAATQHAFKALADSLRDEVNPAGVRVLSVHPGRTATERIEAVFEHEGRPYRPELLLQPEDIAAMVVAAVTLPRTAEVTEIRIRPFLKSY